MQRKIKEMKKQFLGQDLFHGMLFLKNMWDSVFEHSAHSSCETQLVSKIGKGI